jgi:hypothetical protein
MFFSLIRVWIGLFVGISTFRLTLSIRKEGGITSATTKKWGIVVTTTVKQTKKARPSSLAFPINIYLYLGLHRR